MELFMLRHGKAGQSSDDPDDATRPLTPGGREEIRQIARWILKERFRFDIIASSPLTRASETAGIVAKVLDRKDRLHIWEELTPGGDPEAICRRAVQSGDDKVILLVGHEPELSTLVGRIISRGGTASVVMAKGSLAKIRNFSFDKEPSGELLWLLTPKQIIERR
ncbi:MAG TPA: phosphohistidine phosphatase SixA [Methanoregula sp.]|nr:phosphohistidine phosphatase SixA [Methanoregula sp.]